ncbi:MAG TPA: hypothetical protein PLV53_08835 [Anaerolineaceae bacterium]|nr:hypothetical protein [Anaerolineaceae bacterium]
MAKNHKSARQVCDVLINVDGPPDEDMIKELAGAMGEKPIVNYYCDLNNTDCHWTVPADEAETTYDKLEKIEHSASIGNPYDD